jgi:hypothetical protein
MEATPEGLVTGLPDVVGGAPAILGGVAGGSAPSAQQLSLFEARFTSMEAALRGDHEAAEARAASERANLQTALDAAADRVAALEIASLGSRVLSGGDAFRSMQAQAELCEQLLANAGFGAASKPRYLEVVLAARSDRLHSAAAALGDDEEIEDRAQYCVAELPVGIAPYPPAIFSAVEQQYTKSWHRNVLAKPRESRGEVGAPPSLQQKEGESLSNRLLWMEFALISFRLAYGSMEPGPSKEFTEMGIEYLEVSYEALRTRVDDVTINHINPDAANLYARDQKVQRESSLLLPNAQRHVSNYKAQTSHQISKLVANREASRPLGTGNVPVPRTPDVETKSLKASRLKTEAALHNKKAGATKSKAVAAAKTAALGTGGVGRGPSSTGANAPGSTTAASNGGAPTRPPAAAASAAASPRGQGA